MLQNGDFHDIIYVKKHRVWLAHTINHIENSVKQVNQMILEWFTIVQSPNIVCEIWSLIL